MKWENFGESPNTWSMDGENGRYYLVYPEYRPGSGGQVEYWLSRGATTDEQGRFEQVLYDETDFESEEEAKEFAEKHESSIND